MWTHTCKHTHSCHLKSVALQNEHLFMSYEENQCFPVLKEPVVSKVCVCVCLPACAHLHACTLKHACFHSPTHHAQHYMHESADVIVLVIITMMVFVYLQRWKKVDGGWMSAVSGVAESGAQARKREGVRKMESGEEGWIVLCVESERKERASCGMFTCQCSPSSDWSYLCACVWVCVCLCFQMGFHIEILGSPIL